MFDFVRALQRTGKYDVRVFRTGAGPDYDYHGIHVYRFEHKELPCGFAPFLMHRINKRAFLKKVKAVGIDWKNVAVFHAHEITYPLFVKDIKREYPELKILLHFHSGPLVHLKTGRLGVLPIHSTFLYLYYRRNLELVDLPIFVSRRQQRLFGKWYANGYLKEPVDIRRGVWLGRWLRPIRLQPSIVLYNGIDYSVFNSTGRQSHVGFRIGCLGNVSENKDQMTLLKAVDILVNGNPSTPPPLHLSKPPNRQPSTLPPLQPPPSNLKPQTSNLHPSTPPNLQTSTLPPLQPSLAVILVGSGEALPACKRYVEEHGLSEVVEFRTEVDHLALPDFYRSLDLFVLPSWVEGFCCAYVEAYGCGTPVMGCKGVSIEEALSEADQDKWLIVPSDAEGLAGKIAWYMKTHEHQQFVRRFDIDELVGKFIVSCL